MKSVHVNSARTVFEGFFRVEEATLRYEKFSGELSRPVKRLNLDRGDSSAAVLWRVADKKVILVNQFKYPTFLRGPGWITEVIAGQIARDERPDDAIRREILEEVGMRVTRLVSIGLFYVSPGTSSERIFLYFAETEDLPDGDLIGGLESEDEDIKRVELSLTQLRNLLDDRQLVDAKTIIAANWLLNSFGT